LFAFSDCNCGPVSGSYPVPFSCSHFPVSGLESFRYE
jgi:hypothetical protein